MSNEARENLRQYLNETPDEGKAESALMNLLSQKYSNISNVLLSQIEIALKALSEISEMRYKAGGETEEAEIARRAIENINSR